MTWVPDAIYFPRSERQHATLDLPSSAHTPPSIFFLWKRSIDSCSRGGGHCGPRRRHVRRGHRDRPGRREGQPVDDQRGKGRRDKRRVRRKVSQQRVASNRHLDLKLPRVTAVVSTDRSIELVNLPCRLQNNILETKPKRMDLGGVKGILKIFVCSPRSLVVHLLSVVFVHSFPLSALSIILSVYFRSALPCIANSVLC